MKNILLMVLFELCVNYISCNDSILSKFHQNIYKVKDVRMELISYNEEYYNFIELKTFKYNRTAPAINLTANFKIAVKDKMEILIQCFKFVSNQYRHFPIRFQVNLKKAFAANVIGLKETKSCGNLGNFTFEKNVTYTGCNFIIDESHLPPLIPDGRYKVDMKLLYLNEEIAFLCAFGEIYTPFAYPKK